jgi:DNA-binding XRE family transcriptional regulator
MVSAERKHVEIKRCKIVNNGLTEAIRKMGLTQEETSRRAQITTRQLTRFIKNEHCPSLERARALSVVLDEPVERLFQLDVRTRSTVWPRSAFDQIPPAE